MNLSHTSLRLYKAGVSSKTFQGSSRPWHLGGHSLPRSAARGVALCRRRPGSEDGPPCRADRTGSSPGGTWHVEPGWGAHPCTASPSAGWPPSRGRTCSSLNGNQVSSHPPTRSVRSLQRPWAPPRLRPHRRVSGAPGGQVGTAGSLPPLPPPPGHSLSPAPGVSGSEGCPPGPAAPSQVSRRTAPGCTSSRGRRLTSCTGCRRC